MKLRDLTPEHVGKWFVWINEQPYPQPFEYLGTLPEINAGEGESAHCRRAEDMYDADSPVSEFSMFLQIYGDIELHGPYTGPK